ncbi:hypothetical protein Patl1_14651 [Pistacia atlantica]|uniref:Uncharacterized protein n=1 Tax=Pistacia atlantica TaxID=434234 RepID=A0ACC1ASF9_9ROSI|nr:hypothetical protein Patl1_14651 [Pistacia atlantica]
MERCLVRRQHYQSHRTPSFFNKE